MKFGINMALWSDDLTGDDYLPVFEELKQLGYDGVELPIFKTNPDAIARLSKSLSDIGLELTSSSALIGEEHPIGHDLRNRALATDKIHRVLECCQAGNIPLLIGPIYASLGKFTGKSRTSEEWENSIHWVREISVYAQTCGVTLALEFLNRFEIYFLNCAEDMAKFVREINHSNCRMMYDTFHAHIEHKDIGDALRSCSDVLQHVHISENDRSTPGTGQVNWKETFSVLKEIHYDGWLTIEAFGQALPSLAAATKIWRPMFTNELTLAKEGLAFMKSSWM